MNAASEVLPSIPFSQQKASLRLKELAKRPFDLTQPGNLSPSRLSNYSAGSCGYKLLYGTERVDEEVLKTLELLAKETEALDKMQKMQAGEVVNYIAGAASENREALHTATRDFFNSPNGANRAKEAAALAKKEIEKLKSFINECEKTERYNTLVMIGIGGSDLGPRASFIALEYLKKPNRNIYFVSNVDPDEAAAVLSQIDLKKTLVVVVSKTGTTLETSANEEFFRSHFAGAGINVEDHFVSVTMQGSPMDDPNKYFHVFYIWDWVGGRYSTTSMVGGVVLSFACGFPVFWELLKGAHEMDTAALQKDLHKNLPLIDALLSIWNRNFLSYQTSALIPYSQALCRYPAHIQQVEMESNGKQIDQNGMKVSFETAPILWGEAGTNAQHSFFQLLHQGTAIVPIEFVAFKESQKGVDVLMNDTTSQQKLLANLFAQSFALAMGKKSDNPNQAFSGNRPSRILIGKKLTPYALGALLAHFEHKVAFEGFIWGINSFDQEGVQLGKKLASHILDQMLHREGKKKKVPPFPEAESYLQIIESL